jgi:DNA-binding MarR family transcriptional regulator
MASHEQDGPSGYWYADDPAAARAVEVLHALHLYRDSGTAARRRTRSEMDMGDTDLQAIRYLLEARARGFAVSPSRLGTRLGISSASTTTLIDRLVKSGHARREPHPRDRRALVVVPTESADTDVQATLAGMHARMMDVARSLSSEEAATVITFLDRMREAIEGPAKC